jgi:hypothetical protein
MEPLLIDYYNEYPSFVKIIETLNNEYSELQNKYDSLDKTLNEYKHKYEPQEQKDNLMRKCILFKGTHYDIAKLVHHIYNEKLKCISLHKKQWVIYNGEKKQWDFLDNESSIRVEIFDYLTRIFENEALKYSNYIHQNNFDLLYDPIMNAYFDLEYRCKIIMELIHRLKSPKHKNHIMKECRELFYCKNKY